MRIYRHALESIFGMLEVGDLAQVLAVSHSWLAAVRSMKPLSATIGEKRRYFMWPRIALLVASPLLRHLAVVEIRHAHGRGLAPVRNASLALLAQHAPHLQSLRYDLSLTSNEPLILPPKLTSLNLQLNGGYSDAEINGLLMSLAALPSLSRLCHRLAAFKHTSSVELSLLGASRSLSDLTLLSSKGDALKETRSTE